MLFRGKKYQSQTAVNVMALQYPTRIADRKKTRNYVLVESV